MREEALGAARAALSVKKLRAIIPGGAAEVKRMAPDLVPRRRTADDAVAEQAHEKKAQRASSTGFYYVSKSILGLQANPLLLGLSFLR